MEENKDKPVENASTEMVREQWVGIEKQVQAEFNMAWEHQKPKKDEWLVRLKLYNNQKRDKDAAGDTTLFSIFQTVLASLYVDRLTAEWVGREEGDQDAAENLNAIVKYDYEEMGKDESDFFWIWDTGFFGRGLLNLSEWVRDPKHKVFVPAPEVWDPVTFLRDPRANSVNGDKLLHRNAARFYGREVRMGREAMEDNPNFFKDIDFGKLKYGSSTKSLLADAEQARANAQGNQLPKAWSEDKLGANAEYDLTEWYTHFKIDGKVRKVKVWLGNERRVLVGAQVLEGEMWPLIDRPLYPTSHDWDGTSIPDLVEDKQRLRAVAQNLGIKIMMSDLYPSYLYDNIKITNKNDLNFGFNKWIGVAGPIDNAATPLRKASPNMALLDFIYNSLDVSAQKATATSEIQQGLVSQKDKTLGEVNLATSRGDTRYSLSAKVFGWSETRFWQQHYWCYKTYFKEGIDEKVLRLESAFGPKWRKLTKDQITTATGADPDLKIESLYMSRAKMIEDRQSASVFFAVALQDPGANRRYAMRELARLYGWPKDKIDRLFPPTIDELNAEDENDLLNDNKLVQVSVNDDHVAHLEMHTKAAETRAKEAHVRAHRLALTVKKAQPELFPQAQPGTTQGGGAQPEQVQPLTARSGNTPVAPSETSNQPAQPAAQ